MEQVKIWEETVVIPTYEVGEADKNPMFLEKRVYQGSTGKVYPYPTIEKIQKEKVDHAYRAVFLENEYLKIMVLPELGGRVQRAIDKTNGYDFIYYNQVIKPALVGLTGPWISGGIEFNWPQHHRPTTFMPVDSLIQENNDGSKTLYVNDVDQMYGTKGIAAFTLYPDKAYLEIRGQLYNKTPMAQTFLWWANPAVAVNEHTQSIFPPDVHYVMDHGKRDVSRFPIAKGVYYKHDYSEGVDISRYKNIPVPTSYMAEPSEYDFVGGYDYQKKAGLLHVADHHISPGKKQWTWGCGDFGKAWDRNLTDEDGPYIELMTGMFTDNQPDFTWLKPFEEKTFTQYFMPYKQVGQVKNATIHAAVNIEWKEKEIYLCVYATSIYETANIQVSYRGTTIYEIDTFLSPTSIYETTIAMECSCVEQEELLVQVYAKGQILVEYQPKEKKHKSAVKPAEAAKEPKDIMTTEELFLTGQHIEQYRHATYLPDPYYLEGLKRDEGDIRINNAYGCLMMRRGHFEVAERHFNKALERLTWKNPNPYDSEVYYNLGLVLLYQNKIRESYDAFYKATWSNEQQEMSYYFLAVLAAKERKYEEALAFCEKGLIKNVHNVRARGLKLILLRKLDIYETAKDYAKENLAVDPFDYVTMFEQWYLEPEEKEMRCETLQRLMRNHSETYLQVAREYGEAGFYEEAIAVLEMCFEEKPMLHYYKAYFYCCLQEIEMAITEWSRAEESSPLYCFPNKLEDIKVLEYAIQNNPNGSYAYYYLGNLYYDKLQYEKATRLWETSARLNSAFPTVHRNLALSYFNKMGEVDKAKKELEKAFQLDKSDARVFYELDQLYKKLGLSIQKRLNQFEQHYALCEERDDLLIEYITLHNLLGLHEKAYHLMMSHTFRPWEGAEGKITSQYKIALVEMAKNQIHKQEYHEAKKKLERALVYPKNLGEGKLEGTKDNDIYYYLGVVHEYLKEEEQANACFNLAESGSQELAGVLYYNDQPADMILYQGLAKQKLGKQKEANACFYKLLEYGESHFGDDVRVDYFAVSLPDFLIFEDDLNARNKAHCEYLMGLGELGFGNISLSEKHMKQALQYDRNHQNCSKYLNLISIIH